MTRFRLATYNVHKCKGIDLRVSPSRIAEVIAEFKPDIIAAQEILHSQADAVSNHLGLPVVFGNVRKHAGEPYGNAVFSHLPVLSWRTHNLTVPGREARQCLQVSLKLTTAQPLHLFAVHLGTSFFERRKQAQVLTSADVLESAELCGSRILAGDFNEWTHGLASQLLSQRLHSADVSLHLKQSKTYPGLLPFLHLDHIYYDPVFQLLGMQLHRTRLSLLASDHLPLIADFELGSPG